MRKLILILCLLSGAVQAQLKLGNNPTTKNANSLLEMEHTTKGMLLPRVSLTSTTSYSPLSATIVAGFMIYNTNASATAGSSSYPVNVGVVGVYWWDGSGWVATQASTAFARANHTGTQTASTISDFDTQVASTALLKSNNLSDLSNASTARTNLGLAIGTNVQAFSSNLSTYAGIAPTTVGQNLIGLTNPNANTFPRFNTDNTVSALDAATFRAAIGAGTSSTNGTVTSVGGTGTVSGITLSGTVTNSGSLTLGGTLSVTPSNFASQTANTVLAAPNGVAGTPTFRALVAADIPTLGFGNGGTGQTTQQAAMNALAGAVTSGLFLRGNGTNAVMAAIQAADLPSSIDAAKIGGGAVSNTEFSYMDGVTSAIQTQLDGKTSMPAGVMAIWGTASAPTGWLICDGTAVSRSTYAALFAVIGTTYGTGNGSTTFNLPNLQGRVPVGKNSGTFSTLGSTGGAETHTLTYTEMPAHTHSYQDGYPSASAGWYAQSGGAYNIRTNTDTGKTTGSAGSGGAHNNLQPYIVLNYIIKI